MTHAMKNAAYAALTKQGYLPTSKTDRMAVVDVVVDVVMAELRAEVQVMKDEAGQALLHAETTDEVTAASVGISVLDDVLALIDGSSE